MDNFSINPYDPKLGSGSYLRDVFIKVNSYKINIKVVLSRKNLCRYLLQERYDEILSHHECIQLKVYL